MRLGVCWYPEHWPEAWWAEDARRMAEIGTQLEAARLQLREAERARFFALPAMYAAWFKVGREPGPALVAGAETPLVAAAAH